MIDGYFIIMTFLFCGCSAVVNIIIVLSNLLLCILYDIFNVIQLNIMNSSFSRLWLGYMGP